MFGVSVLVASLCIASVLSLEPIPFKVRELNNTSEWPGVESRIHGGHVAQEGEFKFMIFTIIRQPSGITSQCSASLITENSVLLAAHCLYYRGLSPRDIIVAGGKAKLEDYVGRRLRMDFNIPIDESRYGLQERRAKSFHIHPGYDDSLLYHDLAIIKLEKQFHLGSVAIIPVSKDEMKHEKACTILGWGLVRPQYQTYELNFIHGKNPKTIKMGCLPHKKGPFICLQPNTGGVCQGDSGSPLVCDGKVWGVASHYESESLNADCGESIEDYYAELYPDLEWIERTTRSSGFRPSWSSFTFLLSCAFASVWTFL